MGAGMSAGTSTAAEPGSRSRGIRPLLRAHWLILVLLAAGAALRVLTTLAYQPALLYIDSFRYLGPTGLGLSPDGMEPIGYDLFVLHPLLFFGGLRLVVIVQHLAGLAMGVLIYRLVGRLGVRRWLAAVAAVPILLDGYQLQIEQLIMSDVWLEFVLVLTAWVLFSRGTPNLRRCGLAGVLLGVGVLLRVIAVVLVVPAVGLLLVLGWRHRDRLRRGAWRRAGARGGAFLLCWLVIVGGYSGYFYSVTGNIGLTSTNSNVLYARTANAADCSTLELAPELRQFCKPEPRGYPVGIDNYAHLDLNPYFHPDLPPGTTMKQAMHRFAVAVLAQQPLRVAGDALGDFVKGFAPTKTTSPGDVVVDRWQFQDHYPMYGEKVTNEATEHYDRMPPTVITPIAEFLRAYQLHGGYTPGTLLGVAALLGLAGGIRFRRRRATPGAPRAPGVFFAAAGIVILLASDAFEFSWRYQLPGLVLFPLAGALGLAALFTTLRSEPQRSTPQRSKPQRSASQPSMSQRSTGPRGARNVTDS